MAVWAAIPLVILGAGGLAVDSSSPDALCPPLEETRRAVADRLGSVELEGTWHARYVLVHRAQGDFVSLTLADPDGTLRLERELPVQGGSCATLSQVVALVLERFFSRPEHSAQDEVSPTAAPLVASPDQPEALETPAQAPPTPTPRAVPVESDTVQAQPAAVAKPGRFRADGGLWATNSWVAPSIGVESRIAGPYGLAFNAAFDLAAHEEAVGEGSVSLRRVPLSLLGVWHLGESPTFNASAALEVLGVLEQAHASGVQDSNRGTRIVPGIGARLGAHFLSNASAGPFVELTAAWFVRGAAPAFQVGQQEVFPPATQVLGVAFGISTPF